MAKNEDIRIGIIGAGNMGGDHARKIQSGKVPGLKLTAIADHKEELRNKFADVERFEEGSDLIQSDLIDAVLIATPHYAHTTLGIEALKKGLHVLVEKPISVHKEDCEKLIAAYDGNPKQVFAAMFNQRTDYRYQKARELIQSGELGTIRRLNWIITDWFRTEMYYKSGGWRATWGGEGGGVLLNQCPHQLDLWQWLFGMPSRVNASIQIGRFHNIEVEDSVTAVLDYESGVQGVFITTTGETPGVNRLEIVGDRGRLEISGGDTLKFERNEIPTDRYLKEAKTGFEKPPVWNVSIPTKGSGEQHLGILKNFVGAINGTEELIAPAVEGIHSVELANAMLLSGFTDSPIEMPINSAVYAAELKSRIENSTFVKETVEVSDKSDFSKSF
ncbi:MAG: Gfo/Idh/MocA family protein [Puniceicoccales bacterium]